MVDNGRMTLVGQMVDNGRMALYEVMNIKGLICICGINFRSVCELFLKLSC